MPGETAEALIAGVQVKQKSPATERVNHYGSEASMKSDNELTLIKQSQSGDADAFGKLVMLYQNDLLTLAVNLSGARPEAEDIVAETFIRAFKHIRDFRGDSSLKTWLWKILTNVSRSHLRRRYLYNKIFFWNTQAYDDEDMPLGHQWRDFSPGADPEHQAERRSIGQIIKKSMRTLSMREREVFAFKYEKYLKITEIAALLKISPNTVKVLLFRATKKISVALKDYRKI
jgi:RNA polymerase sigma-70 factor (ECF subfamily)